MIAIRTFWPNTAVSSDRRSRATAASRWTPRAMPSSSSSDEPATRCRRPWRLNGAWPTGRCACAWGCTPGRPCVRPRGTRASTCTALPASRRPGTAARCWCRGRRPTRPTRRSSCATWASTGSMTFRNPSGSSRFGGTGWRSTSRRCAASATPTCPFQGGGWWAASASWPSWRARSGRAEVGWSRSPAREAQGRRGWRCRRDWSWSSTSPTACCSWDSRRSPTRSL